MSARLPARVLLYTAQDALKATLESWQARGEQHPDVRRTHELLREVEALRLRELNRRRGHHRTTALPHPLRRA